MRAESREAGPVGGCWLPPSAEQPSMGQNPQRGVPLSCAPQQGEEERKWPRDLPPPPPPGPREQGQEKSGEDERPSTEPLFKVLDTPLSEGDEPATLLAQRDHGHSVQMEGYLGRKHDLEGPNKKASNRCVGKGLRAGELGSSQGPHQHSLRNVGRCWGRGGLCLWS